MERDRIDVLMSVQYALEETGGVARWAVEAKPYIEDKTGGKVVLTFPKRETDDESILPEGCHFLGKAVMHQHHDTRFESSGRVDPKKVIEILHSENIAIPHIVQFEEPLVGPRGTKAVIKALSRVEDGEANPGFVGHVHIAKDHLTRKTKFGIRVAKALYWEGIMRKFDRTLAVSQATVDTWSEFWPVHYDIIPNGIDTEELTPDGPIIKEWKKDGKTTIFFAGRHDRRKGIADLLDAYNLLRQSGRNDIQLKIAGDGYMTEELKSMVKQFKIPDVEFLGKLPRFEEDPDKVDLIKAYRTADVFVGSSRDGEGYNRTVAEALSCGTMAVVTNIAGHRSGFGEAKGGVVFVKPKDPENLAKGIAAVLDLSEEDRRSLGRQGREYIVNNYFWPIVIDKLVKNVYQEVIASKKDRLSSSGIIFP